MKRRIIAGLSAAVIALSMSGCVDQHPEETKSKAADSTRSVTEEQRLVATSPAVAAICDKLELDLVGVCQSNVSTIPSRYDDATQIGMAMSPDVEIVKSLDPDWVLSPSTLQGDLQPKYAGIGVKSAFLNLKSVDGMYQSIDDLGELFGRQEQAGKLIAEYNDFMKEYESENEGKDSPKVLVLMGLPGSYIIATESSYVGSLVKLAGGENVYGDGDGKEFLNVNTEDMKLKEPDVILRCAHALPEDVVEMFNEEFATNDIWKHFEAVENGRVYDLSYEYFGMSANFSYPQALEELQPLLYPEGADEK
ncbi:MAG: heme ABC transporter substrate-binding protein IsdE [Ruminococcus sp.]|nr:heme ABC transporter substrate-binding protein IsdE [Ruminococcus sp.]